MTLPRLHLILLRFFRLGLLAAAVWLIRESHQQRAAARPSMLTAERVRDFFPAAASLEPATNGLLAVKDASGSPLGFVTETSPGSDKIIGYSGPTNTLLVFDLEKKITGLRILGSGDTPDHLAEVIRERKFFGQFRGLEIGEMKEKIDAVAGATLTSTAVADGVMRRLANPSSGESLRFPEAITLDEVRELEPRARSLRERQRMSRAIDVLDASGTIIATAIRTAPASDGVVGYKGPADTLVLMDERAEKIRAIRLRKSFDTKAYVGYVTGDSRFLGLFSGKTAVELASLDFAAAGIEGVSGATETSWAVAEGLKRRAQALVAERKAAAPWWQKVRWRWQDTGHVMVILSALLMAFTSLRGHALARGLHHLLLVVYAGFISGELLSQALFAGWARHGVPWQSAPGLLLLAAVALLGPAVSRRQLYCHHICPHGALQQLVMRKAKRQWSPPPSVSLVFQALPFALLLFVFVSAVAGWAVDLNLIEPFDAYLLGIAGWITIAIAVAGLVWSAFTPMAYCKFGCPTGALFKLLRWSGDADRIGRADWLSLAVVAAAAAWVYAN